MRAIDAIGAGVAPTLHASGPRRERRDSRSRAAWDRILMNAASLPQAKMMRAIDAIGARVAPALHQASADLEPRERHAHPAS